MASALLRRRPAASRGPAGAGRTGPGRPPGRPPRCAPRHGLPDPAVPQISTCSGHRCHDLHEPGRGRARHQLGGSDIARPPGCPALPAPGAADGPGPDHILQRAAVPGAARLVANAGAPCAADPAGHLGGARPARRRDPHRPAAGRAGRPARWPASVRPGRAAAAAGAPARVPLRDRASSAPCAVACARSSDAPRVNRCASRRSSPRRQACSSRRGSAAAWARSASASQPLARDMAGPRPRLRAAAAQMLVGVAAAAQVEGDPPGQQVGQRRLGGADRSSRPRRLAAPREAVGRGGPRRYRARASTSPAWAATRRGAGSGTSGGRGWPGPARPAAARPPARSPPRPAAVRPAW